MDPDFYSSSDVEVEERPNRFKDAGKKAIASIAQASVVDRIESKKAFKSLTAASSNVPGTAYSRSFWLSLFNKFANDTLGLAKRPDKTPTGEDVARFLLRLPEHIAGRHPTGAISWAYLKNRERQLERSLTFEYPEFKLTKHQALKIDAAC
ncbi:hypothetical protein LTR66_003269 [Elasticomyces elasticus]|nr:hypothetical protein LTR66_003269 [Elasticomyces elasticus]